MMGALLVINIFFFYSPLWNGKMLVLYYIFTYSLQ